MGFLVPLPTCLGSMVGFPCGILPVYFACFVFLLGSYSSRYFPVKILCLGVLFSFVGHLSYILLLQLVLI